jgi:hypothetical protein
MHKLFSALSQKRKPISKSIFFLLFLGFGLFTVGYEWLLPNYPPEIQTISWKKPLVIEQPTTLEVILTDKKQNINELNVSLENNNFFTLQSHTKKSKNGHHQFIFEILPKKIAKNEPVILHYSDGTHALTKAITINIPRLPPQISRIAPNSPITVTLGEVSTLEIEIDLEHTEKKPDEISVSLEIEPDFISVLSSEKPIVTDNKMTFRFEILPSNVGDNKEIFIHYGAEKLLSQRILVNSNMPYFFKKNGSTFVERLLAPDESIYASHLTVWRENNEHTLVTGHPTSNIFTEVSGTLFNYAVNSANFDDSNFFLGAGLASLPKDDEKWVQKYLEEFKPFKKTFAYISSQYEGLDNLKSLSIALKSHFRLTTQEDHDIDRLKELTSSENLTKAQEIFLRSLINNPTQALDIRQKATWKYFSIFIQEFSHLETSDEKNKIVNKLDQIIYDLESNQFFAIALSSVQEKSCLLKELPNPYIKAQQEIQANLKNWVASEQTPSTLKLKKTLANSHYKKSPKASVILLPYYNSETQEEVTFALPKLYSTFHKTFYSFRQSVINEMKGDLKRAAKRRDEIHTTFLENLEILKSELHSVSPQDFSKWLKQTQTFTFNEYDKRGNLVGTTRKIFTNKAYWLDRLEQAEIARIIAKYYRLAAKNFQTKLAETRKLNIILKFALYDSFLRGWVPSLIDNSLNSLHRQSLQEKRNEVWSLIIASARSQGMDIRPMITESTVFQIQRNGKSIRIRPLFVANPLKTVAVKSKGNSLVYYETPWNNRQLTYLKPENFKQSVWKEAHKKFSENPETGLAILANQYYAKARNQQQWEERVALTRKALLVAPKYMANKLIQQLWDSWPDNGISDAERAQFDQISIKEVNSPTLYLPQLIKGSWPFVDHYLIAVLNLANIYEDQQATLLKKIKRTEESIEQIRKDIQTSEDNFRKKRQTYDDEISKIKSLRQEIEEQEKIIEYQRKIFTVVEYKEEQKLKLMKSQLQLQLVLFETTTRFLKGSRSSHEMSIGWIKDDLSSNKKILEQMKYELKQIKSDRIRLQKEKQTIIKNGIKINKEYMNSGLRTGKLTEYSEKYKKFDSWKANKVVNENLEILACFSRVSFSLDQENVIDTKIKDDMRSCENDIEERLASELLEFFISKNELTVLNQKTIEFRKKYWQIYIYSNRLERDILKQDIQALIQTLAKATIIIANKAYRANPTKALLNSLFRLEWYSGRYKKAFDLALVEISNHSTTKKTERFVKLLRALETEILKALIYSGGQINLAVPGRKASDWIVQPGDIEHIPVDVLTTRLVPN